MALTGRLAVAVALGAVPLVLLGGTTAAAWGVLAGWIALCALLTALDVGLAASPRALSLTRELPARVRLGESVRQTLLVGNGGRRTLRGTLRDAWEPSAGASATRQRVRIPAGERRALTMTLAPTRRGARRVAQITVRAVGPLGLGARQAVLAAPGELRVLPPFLSRKLARLCSQRPASCASCRPSSRASTCHRGWLACANSTGAPRS